MNVFTLTGQSNREYRSSRCDWCDINIRVEWAPFGDGPCTCIGIWQGICPKCNDIVYFEQPWKVPA